MRQVVCKTHELSSGELLEATLGNTPIVVCKTTDGEYRAFSNRCPHQGARLSQGTICGAPLPTDTPGEYNYAREGEILRCPWHGREFDLTCSGQMLADAKRRLPSFRVQIEEDNVVVIR